MGLPNAGNPLIARGGELVKRDAAEYAIFERLLIAATDALGVRTQRGQWWLPR
jgi:hypothetical protein